MLRPGVGMLLLDYRTALFGSLPAVCQIWHMGVGFCTPTPLRRGSDKMTKARPAKGAPARQRRDADLATAPLFLNRRGKRVTETGFNSVKPVEVIPAVAGEQE